MRSQGEHLEGFGSGFQQGNYKFNLYDRISRFIPSKNLKKYALNMFNLTVCAEEGLFIEANRELNLFELVYLDNIRIQIPLKNQNYIDIVEIGKSNLQ
mgnify:CR=1 FL=1